MLHVYYGTDRHEVRDAAVDFQIKNLPPDGTVTTIDAQSFAPGQIANALGATSLFGGAEWFVIDSPAEDEAFQTEVLDHLVDMRASANTFIILEGALLAPAKKSYTKHTTNPPQEFTATKANKFNSFVMADALADRDRRKLWVLLQEARLNGQPPEAIIGILWWQLKSLQLAAVTRTPEEAGMKDFPYNKAKRALSKFAPGEVGQLSHSLLQLYHDGHAGVQDINLALERWVLGGR
jgi:DNA polymerase III delta subunit